jgi:WD40 repeat protein
MNPEDQDMAAGAEPMDDANVDELGEFIDMADAIEVQVDDDDMPMEEEDDDEEEEDRFDEEPDVDVDDTPIVDMSKSKLETHSDSVYTVACYLENNGQLSVLSGGGDDKSYMHKLVSPGAGGTATHQLSYNHTDSVSCVAFNMLYISDDLKKTPRLAAVGSFDGAIVLYDPDSGEQKLKLEGPSDVEWVSFHPKGGSVILAGSGDGTVWMFHIPLNKCLQVFVGHEQGVSAGGFSPDGKWALSASADGTLRVWAPKTGMSRHVFRLGEAGLTCMANGGGSDGMLVMVGSEDGAAHLCHIGTKKVVATLRHFEHPVAAAANDEDDEVEYPMSVEAVGFSPLNPNWCATGGVNGVLKIWDLTNGQCRHTCKAGEELEGITRLRWHPTAPIVFTATSRGRIHLWDARNGSLVQTLTGHTEMINDLDVQFLDSGVAVIVTAGDDKTVRVFEVDIGALLQPAVTSTV